MTFFARSLQHGGLKYPTQLAISKPMCPKRVLFLLLFPLVLLAGLGLADRHLLPWMLKLNFVYRAQQNAYPKSYLEALGLRESLEIRKHLTRALSKLENPSDEWEVAGAVNDYVHQLLLRKDHSGPPHDILRDGHAVCCGHATVMSVLLAEAGISSDLAYLMGVPYQGGHSLVQVNFSNGQSGLYDPSFGLFWWDEKRQVPLNMEALKLHPAWASQHILRSKNPKRTTGLQPIKEFPSVREVYETFHDEGAIHYQEMWEHGANAGVARHDYKVFRHLKVRQLPLCLGSWELQGREIGGQSLARVQNEEGRPESWLHLLGKQAHGENISHVYELENLEVGQTYRLTLGYTRSVGSGISATVVGGRLEAEPYETGFFPVEDFGPVLGQKLGWSPTETGRKVVIRFIPQRKELSLIVNNEGDMRLHAIEFGLNP